MIPSRRFAAGLLAALLISACGNASPPSHHPAAAKPSAPATSTPTHATPNYALTVRVPDPHCPDDKGIGVNAAEWTSQAAGNGDDFPGLAAAMEANGDTLVIASGDPTPTTAIAAEFRTPCDLDPAYGDNGATQLSAPGFPVNVSGVFPTADGGALITGGTSVSDGRWFVGKLTAGGQLDQAFGDHGWALLPWAGTATTIAVAPNGNIVVGGLGNDNGISSVGEISAQGRPVTSFGTRGQTAMPPWHDGGVDGVWIEPDGNILALVGGGNMGCWGVTAVTLTPSGRGVPGFTAAFDRALKSADPDRASGLPIFVGGLTVGSHGFHLVGTAQDDCVGNPPQQKPNPSQRVIDIAFGYDGNLDTAFGKDGVTSFSAPMASLAWVLPQSDASVLLVTSPYRGGPDQRRRDDVFVYRISDTGRLETNYADHGLAVVTLPYVLGSGVDYVAEPRPVSNGQRAAVVTLNAKGNAVVLIQVAAR